MSLVVENLTATFPTPKGLARAVDGVSFAIAPGEILGLVGESGSGKSVTLRAILRLVRPPGRIAGRVEWQGRDLMQLPPRVMQSVRGGEIAMIFQEPATALNPALTVRAQIEESLRAHTTLDAAARHRRAIDLLDRVGMPDAARRVDDYPHQFSGGMRQRVMIAIALASEPKLLLADEPTTALDVTIQDQILNLILSLRDSMGMSVLFVTHDLGVVAAICDRVAVMYAGRVVETADVNDLFDAPRHPYTAGLLGSVPHGGPSRIPLLAIDGLPPSLTALPPGCSFAPRCRYVTESCRAAPPLREPLPGNRTVACLHYDRVTTP